MSEIETWARRLAAASVRAGESELQTSKVRTCANCVEIRPCELAMVDGKWRPLCIECRAMRPDELHGPSYERPVGGADPTYHPRLDQIEAGYGRYGR